MNNINLKNIADNLINTFLEAGKIAKDIAREGVKITMKPDNNPGTDGDLKVDQLLTNKIREITPNIPIISEETFNLLDKNKKYKDFWLIDPIDGTKEYIKKGEEYTLNAALIINTEPSIGIIYAPEKERLFYSFGYGEAFEITNNKKKSLNCLKKTEKGKVFALHNSLIIEPDILDEHKKNKVINCTKMSSSLKFCTIAAGEADIYIAKPRAYEWDIAAGHAIVQHAGGIFTTREGKKIIYGKHDYKNPAIMVKRSNTLHI